MKCVTDYHSKFEHSKTFGLVNSANSNVIWSADDGGAGATARITGAGKAVVGGNEEVLVWDVKKGELLARWRDSTCGAQVTAIAKSAADPDVYAVGYGDGSIRVWDSTLATVVISFNGHKSAITTLTFDRSGSRLASGSQDTDITIWDLVAEVGLFKLRGHKGQITGLQFLHPSGSSDESGELQVDENGLNGTSTNGHSGQNSADALFLLSTGKDAVIKLWDLAAQHCIETHMAQANGECWSLGVSRSEDACITAGNEGELRVWTVDIKGLGRLAINTGDNSERRFLHERGTFYRHNKDKTTSVSFHESGSYIAVHGSDRAVEVFRVRSLIEVQKSLTRKRKRRREKAKGSQAGVGLEEEDNEIDVSKAEISEFITPYVIVRPNGKVKSIHWADSHSRKTLRLLVSTTNNLLELYDIVARGREKKISSDEPPDYDRTFAVDMPGHRADVRSVSLSSDDRMLSSASSGALKIWNVRTQSCIRSLECGYALCSAFLPGDKIVIVGNKNGELELFDIASSTLIETVKAHGGPVWTLHVHPDGKSIVSGSADKTAKFWSFEIVQEEVPGTRRTTPQLRLVHTRTLKVADDILSVRFSPDGRLLAVALLDNTVKVFFVDSLKLFLQLYGHKLPVLNMDISFDSKLIVTCSADKNVRIWGLDFGDCHKALFAHQDSVMQVAFVPHNQDGNGHHFFSASKDGFIKYWDGDKFEQIQRLHGHHGEIWALAVSRTGDFLISASHDKSIRLWQQTDEQIFLEEEREKELEEMYEKTLTTSLEQEDREGEDKSEAVAAGKQTGETLMAGERIVEALELSSEDLELMSRYRAQKAQQPSLAPPQRNLVFMAYNYISAEEHVLSVLQKIKAAALQDALLVLPFERIPALFIFLRIWAERQMDMTLTCRVLFFMLKTHHRQIVASKTMRPMLDDIRVHLRQTLQKQKDEMGFNMAALRFVGNQVKQAGISDYVDEDTWEEEESKGVGKKKRAFVDVA